MPHGLHLNIIIDNLDRSRFQKPLFLCILYDICLEFRKTVRSYENSQGNEAANANTPLTVRIGCV